MAAVGARSTPALPGVEGVIHLGYAESAILDMGLSGPACTVAEQALLPAATGEKNTGMLAARQSAPEREGLQWLTGAFSSWT